MKFGFIGAGYVARAMSALLIKHGHEVMLSNSRDPKTLYVTSQMLKCRAGTASEAIAFSDIVVLAIPLAAYVDIDHHALDGKLVIDTCNYHPRRDGAVPALDRHETTTSEIIAAHFAGARVVKAFNAVLATKLEELTRNGPTSPPMALPLAGNESSLVDEIAKLHKALGIEPVIVGGLDQSWRFERNQPAYCSHVGYQQLCEQLAGARKDMPTED